VAKTPNSFDRQVGMRLRQRRLALGLTQAKLGEQLGVTFQQVQKYEKGRNRIGASRLQEIARVLGTPAAYFFEGQALSSSASGMREPDQQAYVIDFLATAEGLALNRAFAGIRSAVLRRKVLDLVTAIAQQEALQADAAEPDDA
jgi:transcriptional regulator with XRE-family HTH domain